MFGTFSDCSRARRRGRRANHLRAVRRPSFEALEDRCLLSFSPAVSYPVGPDPVAVATADFNNDGRLDLATANAGDATVSVLLGDGLGGFGAASEFATGASPRSLAVGDFDGDGNLDLATANQGTETYFLRYVSVLLGNGDGTFRPPVTTDMYSYPFYLYPRPIAPVAADFDTDGKTDLAFVTQGSCEWCDFQATFVQVLLSDGQGGFAGPQRYGDGLGEFSDLAVADLNADGRPDVVLGSTGYDYDGSQFGYVNVALNGSSFWYYFETSPWPRLGVGDFTRDDIPDLVIAGQTLDVWPGDGNGSFGSPISTSPGGAVAAVADFNGDGALDVDTGGSILLGLGDGTFTASIDYGGGASPTVGDFNGDGPPDVAIADAGSNMVWVMLNDRDWGQVNPLPGDFDGDGEVDGRDFLAWQRNPSVGNLSDWQENYGTSQLSVVSSELIGANDTTSGADPGNAVPGLGLVVMEREDRETASDVDSRLRGNDVREDSYVEQVDRAMEQLANGPGGVRSFGEMVARRPLKRVISSAR